MNEKEIRSLIEMMENSTFIIDDNKYIMKDFLIEHIETKKQRIGWNSYKKFCLFASCLLLRNQSGTIVLEDKEYYKSNLLLEKLIKKYPTIELNWNEETLFQLIDEARYSSYKKSAPIVLQKAKKIFSEKYNSDLNYYISLAEKNIENHFQKDFFLGINGVKYKTRDLGVSCFSNRYLSVDRHLLKVTKEIGLSKFSNISNDIWNKDCPGNKKEYISVVKFLIHIAEIADVTPYYLDRLFWNYGKRVLEK